MVDKVWQGYHPGKIFASSLPNSLHKSYHVSFLEDIVQREAQQGSTNHIIDIDIELAIMFLFPISNMSYSENMNDSISRTWVIHLPASTSQTLKLFPWTIYPGMITCHYLYGIHGIKMCPFYNLKLSFLNIYIYILCHVYHLLTRPIFDDFSQPKKRRNDVGAPRKGCDGGLPHCQFRQVLLTQRTGPCMGGYTKDWIKRL